jgi:DNA topoisomerase-1
VVSVGGRKVPSGKDFDSATGQIKDGQLLLLDEGAARDLAARLKSGQFRVASVEERPYTRKPADPFTTSLTAGLRFVIGA